MAPPPRSSRHTTPPAHNSAARSRVETELPLTPPNSQTSRSASFGLDTGDLAFAVDLTEAPTPLLDAVDEHLRRYEVELCAVSESEEERLGSEPEDYYKSQVGWDQPTDQTVTQFAVQPRSGHHRSSSAPAKPLKSALAKSPPGSPPSEYENGMPKRKKARFVDDPSGSDLSLRRRATAPDYILAATINTAFSSGQVPWYGDDDDSGRNSQMQGITMSTSMLGDSDDALTAEADDAAAEMAEDAEAAEGAVDSTAD